MVDLVGLLQKLLEAVHAEAASGRASLVLDQEAVEDGRKVGHRGRVLVGMSVAHLAHSLRPRIFPGIGGQGAPGGRDVDCSQGTCA